MEHSTLVSLIILGIRDHYLIQKTLDSILEQTENRYEIIVMMKDISSQDFHKLREYSDKIERMQHTLKSNRAKIMNQARKLAKGKYLHYLFPGEVYISKHSLEYVKKKIETKKDLDLVCFSRLKRDISLPPEVQHASFLLKFKGKERFPIFAKDCFFSRKKVQSLRGFSQKYQELESFDMISKIYKKGRFLCCRRVLVDFELKKVSPKKVMVALTNLVAIIYKNFGFFQLFHWYILREMKEFFALWLRGIKKHFIQTE